MSRKERRRSEVPQTSKPLGALPRSRFRWNVAVVLVGILLVLGLAGGWWSSRRVLLPPIDLAKADSAAAASLRQRMDEVRRTPRSGMAWGQLGALLWAYDFRPEARVCLSRAEALDPSNPRWPYYQALSLMIATPQEAIPCLQRAVKICGNTPPTPRFRLAYLLAEQGRWDEARQEFEPLLAEHPDFTPVRLLAARDAQGRGEFDKAIELARGCTEDSRTARSAHVLLVGLYRQRGNTHAANQALRLSTSLPQDEFIEDPFHAEATLLRADPRALCEQAHPLLAAGHLTQAAALIDKVRLEHADYPETWLLVGRLQYLRKDLPGAEQALRRHVEMNPRSAQGFFQLGGVLLAGGQLTNAAAIFEKAIQLKPDFGPAHYNRGLALGRAGQTNAALAAFRESLRHNPERLETYLFLADLHLRAGERESAAALLDQAELINPTDARLRSLRQRLGER
ncbi:MAG: tetratricopeptide repeat protein [Verrucomicrobiia bacterium]